jgi:hypothetical protein
MFRLALFLIVGFGTATAADVAMAQAATGGTKDTAAPTMVVPIRPRNEPAGTTAVPNGSQQQQSVVRLRRTHSYRAVRPR